MPGHSSFFSWTTYRKSQKCDEDNPERRNFLMLKKAVPVVAMCSVLLVGCNMNKNVPNNNETPMGEVREDVDRIVPNSGVNTPSPSNNVGNDNYNNNFGNDRLNEPNNGVNGVEPRVKEETVPNANNDVLPQPNTGNEVIQDTTTNNGIMNKDKLK